MRRFTYLFERFVEALYASRQLEAERVIRRHGHFFEQAQAYERTRALDAAKAVADAKTSIAQAGLQFVPWSAP
jgi:hypothetical protein